MPLRASASPKLGMAAGAAAPAEAEAVPFVDSRDPDAKIAKTEVGSLACLVPIRGIINKPTCPAIGYFREGVEAGGMFERTCQLMDCSRDIGPRSNTDIRIDPLVCLLDARS